jgi:hypothetical protein
MFPLHFRTKFCQVLADVSEMPLHDEEGMLQSTAHFEIHGIHAHYGLECVVGPVVDHAHADRILKPGVVVHKLMNVPILSPQSCTLALGRRGLVFPQPDFFQAMTDRSDFPCNDNAHDIGLMMMKTPCDDFLK